MVGLKTLIHSNHIIDGTGRPAFAGDILLSNDSIVEIGQICRQSATRYIDATDYAVCPGFIDTHTHSDLQILRTPAILPKIYQGVTTEILGQDGIGMAPLPKQYISQWQKNIGGLDGTASDISWDYPTLSHYIQQLRYVSPCLNYGVLAPHGNIRLEVMGFSNQPASEVQLLQMEAILRREMAAGALGMSTGLVYVPCVYAATEELIRLCKVVRQYNGVFVVHQRYESNRILESMQELYIIARESGVRLHISHFKISGKQNLPLLRQLLDLLAQWKQEGICVTYDQYPYEAGSTMLGRIIPPWAHEGGTEEMLRRLQDPKARERIRNDILFDSTNWDNMYLACGPEGIVVSSVITPENQVFVGKHLSAIGAEMGTDPLSAAFALLIAETNEVGMVNFNGVLESVQQLMLQPEMNVCTDGLLGGRPHPRVYGSFPKMLRVYVEEKKLLSLEQAIHKMTGAPAAAMQLKDRGTLEVGKKADLLIFQPSAFHDQSTYETPCKFATGLKTMFVNGTIVLDDGVVHTDAASGMILKNNLI